MHKSMSFTYEPSSEPLHIHAKQLSLNWEPQVLWLNQNHLRQLPIEIGMLTKLDGLTLVNPKPET